MFSILHFNRGIARDLCTYFEWAISIVDSSSRLIGIDMPWYYGKKFKIKYNKERVEISERISVVIIDINNSLIK